MKKDKRELKESLKEYINMLLETKFSREQMMEKMNLMEEEIAEKERLIEPFRLIEDEHTLGVEDESTLGLEDELEQEDKEMLDMMEDIDIEEQIKEIAEEIQPVDPDHIIDINNGEKQLIDKVNCRIQEVPLLDVFFVTNKDIDIIKVNMNMEMTDLMDVELSVVIKLEENYLLCGMTVNQLYQIGLLKVVEKWDDVKMSPMEFRGLTAEFNMDELSKLFSEVE